MEPFHDSVFNGEELVGFPGLVVTGVFLSERGCGGRVACGRQRLPTLAPRGGVNTSEL